MSAQNQANVCQETQECAEGKDVLALQIVKRNAAWAAGAGLVPVPYLDAAAIAGVQVKMVSELAKLYEIGFKENQGKTAVSALLGCVLPIAVADGLIGSTLKAIPVVGTLLGVLTVPAFASAATYAMGRVFIQHFEAGGTLLDFDPQAMKAHFLREFEAAKAGRATADVANKK